MSFYDEDVSDDDGFDFDDEDAEIVGEIEQDGDYALNRTITMPAVNPDVLGHKLEGLGTRGSLERALVGDLVLMHQTLGDADATFADMASDLESAIRLHFLELSKNPGTVLMGVLSAMKPAQQVQHIETCMDLMSQRKARIMGNTLTAFMRNEM